VDYIQRVIGEQCAIDIDDVRDDVREFLLELQNMLLPNVAVWGVLKLASMGNRVGAVSTIFNGWSDVQRTQYVLLRDLHSALLLINMAVVSGLIDFETYRCQMTLEAGPDSMHEQSIRAQSTYVELLGRLA